MASPFTAPLTALAALAVVLGLVWLASRAARWGDWHHARPVVADGLSCRTHVHST